MTTTVYLNNHNCLSLHKKNDIIFTFDTSQLEFICNLFEKGDNSHYVIYTTDVYVKNVLMEWIFQWEKEKFKFKLVYDTDVTSASQKEVVLKGKRPNYKLLQKICELRAKKNLTYNIMVSNSGPYMTHLINYKS